MKNNPEKNFSGIILAGGRGRRVGGQDKGLLVYNGKKLVEHVIEAISPLCDDIVISANRNMETYRQYSGKVISDITPDFQGPLAGLHAALPHCRHRRVFVCPCDMPMLTTGVFETLGDKLQYGHIAIAECRQKLQPVFVLQKNLHGSLDHALQSGQRRLMQWVKSQQPMLVSFSDSKAFSNFNECADFR
ncbi:MAG TPA: molybdenum cofactor guanylyltransferase [Thiotrichales bacterium]|nr:molybdenum cofactor guanylyltransferase [Thiotrichales bacterium]